MIATLEKPIRAGVFEDVEQAERVVHDLEAAGFTDEQITVVCSDRDTESHFRPFEHQEPAGYYTPQALVWGGSAGAIAGGVIAAVGSITAGLGGLTLTFCALSALTGAVAGGFFAAMMTRGGERELANFYDQDVSRGSILVAAEDHSSRARQALDTAAHIIEDAGARPIELPEG